MPGPTLPSRRHVLLLGGATLLLSACEAEVFGPPLFDAPYTAAVLHPDDGGPYIDPVGFVSNLRSGLITPLDLKHATTLSDSPAAPWLRARGIATGDERQLGQIVAWAPADDAVSVLALDQAHEVMLEAPYVTAFEDGAPVVAEPVASEPVFVDADGSGDDATVSDVVLRRGWTTTEDWSIEYDGTTWWAFGSRSGQQTTPLVPGEPWSSDHRELELVLSGSATAGDRIELSTDTGIVEHDLGGVPLTLIRLPGAELAAVGVWDPLAEAGKVVIWDLAAGAATSEVELGAGAQPWRLAAAPDDADDAGTLYVGDAWQAAVHRLSVDAASGSAALVDSLETAAPVADLTRVEGATHDGAALSRLLVAPAGLNRVDLYDLTTELWIDANPHDGVAAAGIALNTSVTGIDGAPDPIDVQVLTPWGVRDSAHVATLTTFDGSVMMMDAETGCLVTDIAGPRLTTSSGGDAVLFTDRGDNSTPALQIDEDTGLEVITSTCGGLVRSETWTLTYDGVLGAWTVDGSISGPQENVAYEDERYVDDVGGWSILITSGPAPSTDGDEFRFSLDEGLLRLDSIPDGSQETALRAPGEPVVFQYDAGPTGGGWDVLDRRTFALVPLTGSDLVVRLHMQAWEPEVVWE